MNQKQNQRERLWDSEDPSRGLREKEVLRSWWELTLGLISVCQSIQRGLGAVGDSKTGQDPGHEAAQGEPDLPEKPQGDGMVKASTRPQLLPAGA